MRNAEYQLRRRDGTLITVRRERTRWCATSTARSSDYEGTITDITVRKRAEVQLYEEKEKAQVTLQSIGDAVITADADGPHRVPESRRRATHRLGLGARRPAARSPRSSRSSARATRQPLDNPIVRCLREGRVVEIAEQSLLINRRGQEISIQDSAAPIRDRSGRLIGVVMVFHDVSQERRLQRALAYQATHDALTGLINRREFEHA